MSWSIARVVLQNHLHAKAPEFRSYVPQIISRQPIYPRSAAASSERRPNCDTDVAVDAGVSLSSIIPTFADVTTAVAFPQQLVVSSVSRQHHVPPFSSLHGSSTFQPRTVRWRMPEQMLGQAAEAPEGSVQPSPKMKSVHCPLWERQRPDERQKSGLMLPLFNEQQAETEASGSQGRLSVAEGVPATS
ncbi:hypothetical protein P8C59_007507 [Phyllachora maydis]|uniref:Uncharacterized protein n=1 Tax=Phyllachora maydis TaxID=1825666 RepID=A0AAD9I9P1_9PEZI|nr:hypothetical protein P8C59_007507 [Phyllachora maydis]